MQNVRLALVGFGFVGRAFATLLLKKQEELLEQYGIRFNVTGIITGRHGAAIDPDGIDLEQALTNMQRGESLSALSKQPAPADALAFARSVPADMLFELSPVNHKTGQPAIDVIRAALERGMHAVTANKGPVAHAAAELTALAAAGGKRFMYEATVMDGAPIFSTFRSALPAAKVLRLRAILNSTTNYILEMMEGGKSFEDAVRYCQEIGLAETDPSGDIDGWDAAIKLAILVTQLMGVPTRLDEVDRSGIRGITPQMLADALQNGRRWKLICRAERVDGGVRATVAPEQVDAFSHLYSIRGSGSALEFDLDVHPGVGIYQDGSGPETTAYGLLADMINALRGA